MKDRADKILEECAKNFEKHEIIVLHESDAVKRYQFRRPDTGTYGFSLTCADNLLVMNGDCYSLLIEPGYGRCGLAFLRGSSCDTSYFLSKCPYHHGEQDILTEYSYELAMANLKEYVEQECLTKEDLEEASGLDEGGFWGEHAYYEFCLDKNIDCPDSARQLTGKTLNQIAGLKAFKAAYEKLESVRKK